MDAGRVLPPVQRGASGGAVPSAAAELTSLPGARAQVLMEAAAQSEKQYREEVDSLKYQLKQAKDDAYKWKSGK